MAALELLQLNQSLPQLSLQREGEECLQRQPSDQPWSSQRVDIYEARFDDLLECAHSLSTAEQQRASRFVRADDAARYCAGRTWVRRRLSADLGVPIDELELAVGAQGKPEVPGHPIHFNVSHTDAHIWLAIAARPVGIDLELPPRDDPALLLQQIATQREWERARAAGITTERFLILWTAKEAVLKMLGTGLMTDPRSIELGALGGLDPRVVSVAGQWACLQRVPACDDAIAHVAIAGSQIEVRMKDWNTGKET
ncbi:4'-phosphopantetheinyl transferase superfamily protein [Ruegeria sp. 2205SS24-7]|uniref:4'-phosphopantetheinyl transferase family protein n=1 Tax=Ruegeria discodermiae TaxID=3064389 RepID=UPI002740E56D|nr:4'-phosphopantetheinyl transferase superfamily protein [Ruegeria sp. 2205SS24-7]MDP5218851.1 4'-phosphopantetheinyl transferase superfamily protein [Ruegeria sp. 2205SS24-7]